jgi:hypothetical protein
MDTFISYATEDEASAREIAEKLISHGFSVWYAPLELRIGDSLLAKINEGLKRAKTGLLLITPDYMQKKWTTYELNILFRQHVENDKRIFPIWHNVEKSEVESWHPGISGIIAAKTTNGLDNAIHEVTLVLAENSYLTGVAPSYESPYHRFLNGDGELHLDQIGGALFTLWEALEFDNLVFPIWIDGKAYTKADLAFKAAQALAHNREAAVGFIGEARTVDIESICIKLGFDPELFKRLNHRD